MSALLALICIAALQGDDLLVSTEQLTSMQDVLVVDVRSEEAYTAAHIPGTAHVDVDTLSETRGEVAGLLKPLETVQRMLGEAGIEPSRHVVIYSDSDSAGDFSKATRLFWILEYVGYERVSILDGGFAKWKAEDRETAEGASTVKAVEMPKLIPHDDKLATADEVEIAVKEQSSAIADIRSPDYYRGEKKADVVKEAGHIPTAKNLPAEAFLSESDGTVRSWDELQSIIRDGNVSADGPVITYCNTGRSGSVGYFIMRRMGSESVSLYDGSMSEWTAKQKDVETSPDVEKK
jgi:thiosulfate/3-mercaptopyruvate sulfurtransferase